ncbi:hypothetical protein [Xenophilus sp.]|uniref:hypothetical protein n=1 Tax=Xenophilus sp. TaxID=1873499 RepID=UPI0037DD8B14
MNPFDYEQTADGMQVDELEFAVATGRSCDSLVDPVVGETLRLILQKMDIALAYACEAVSGQRPDATRELSEAGQWYLFDNAFARSLAAEHWIEPGRPASQGCFTVPVVLASGRVVGALYAPRYAGDAVQAQQLLRQVELSAQLIARRIDERPRAAPPADAPSATVMPLPQAPSRVDPPQAWALAA